MIRCRIDLPAGTQVIIDRSPVGGGYDCDLDESGRRSRFQDVLLLPGEFRITNLKGYKNKDSESNEEADDQAQDYIELLDTVYDEPPRSTVMSDNQFAHYMLQKTNNFLDVRLEVVRMMRVPERALLVGLTR
jgi:hypothetical protein